MRHELIPTLTYSTPRLRNGFERNIISVYDGCTPAQRTAGFEWYKRAHELALLLSDGDVVKGAGVIAALSANKSWHMNQQLAASAFGGDVRGHVRDALVKVERILLGEAPEDVLPMSVKTGNFYRCIVDPGDAESVVIDRHAHDIAVGEPWGDADRGLSAKGRYALLSLAYRNAAVKIGILPSQLQAATWVSWTEGLAGTSTRTMEHAS